MEPSQPDPQQLAQFLRLLQGWGVSQLPQAGAASPVQPQPQAHAAASPGASLHSTPAEETVVNKPSSVSSGSSQAASSGSQAAVQLSLLGSTPAPGASGGLWEEPPLPPEKRPQALQELAQQIARCTRCPEPVATRTQTVPGVGNPNARLCFLGEAPGADEDRLGEPFVGRAGQLLNRIIQACGMKREDVYIFNVLKCRPPGNRTPTESEAANCWPFLLRQLQIIRPEFICCLGAVAARTLLNTKAPMGRLRGKVHLFQGIKVVVTYHPAYLLRNPNAKRQTWEDMKLLLREMGLPIPERKED